MSGHHLVSTPAHVNAEQLKFKKVCASTCWRSATALPVHWLCGQRLGGQRHLPTAALHQGFAELPVLPARPNLPIMHILAFLPIHEGCRESDAGRCITAPLADALRI